MAGLYADIPATRFALDQDGATLKYRNYTTSSSWTDVTGSIAELQKVNTANFLDTAGIGGTQYVQFAFAFPEARTINGAYIHGGIPADASRTIDNLTWDYSTDTTDGTDGTWSNVAVTFANFGQHNTLNGVSKPYYRSDIATLSISNVKGLRVRLNNAVGFGNPRLCVLHLYGSRPTTSVDRLAFWHPSTDNPISAAALDFGDIAQGTLVTKQFRVKNLSGSLTANSITVQVSDLLPEYTSGMQVSTDNTTYQNSVNIGNLSSGTISSTLYVRRTVGGAEATTQRHARLLANASTWT